MKKILLCVIVLSLLAVLPAFAEETKKDEMPGMGMPMPGMGQKDCSMVGKVQMVSTDEGGVIVLTGNKLMKYDADLNLVKEVEVKMPVPAMGGKQCPMTGKMMGESALPADAGSQEKTV
jgi:hypothetical protein